MDIELHKIKIRDLVAGYKDSNEEGVVGWNGRLNIRPKYQREFVYKDKQRDAVIDTVSKEFPLNVMYWVKCGEDEYEVLDGQQRTISICQYINGDFSFDMRYFHNLQDDEKNKILDYELMVYFCEGTESEKLSWFKTINIAGEKLTEQEIRNAVYSGSWVSDAKRYFSKTNAPAYGLGGEYMSGSPIRQDYLETAISWISKGNIETYMGNHQHDPNANELWLYFQSVIAWVKATFPTYRKEMKGLDWGLWYNKLKDKPLDSTKLEAEVSRLMQDEDVTSRKGIYEYLLFGDERHLSIRAFRDSDKRYAYENQLGICVKCGEHFAIEEMEADHILPWSKGGKTDKDNCQMLCKQCNRRKSNK
ncbi:MAG: HNH endonuclease family protein [Candidatus Onthomorpha sp.]